MTDRVTFKRSRGKTALLICVALLFVVGGIVIAGNAEDSFDRIAGWACAVFFAAAAISGTRKLLSAGDVFTFDRNGIADHSHDVIIPWTEVDEVLVLSVRGVRFLSIQLQYPEQFLARVSPAQRKLAAFNERMGWGHWAFTFSGVTPGIDEALRFIHANVPAVRAPAA